MCKKLPLLLFIVCVNILSVEQTYGVTDAVENKSVDKFTLTAIYFNQIGLFDNLEFFPLYEKHLGARVQISTLKNICSNITNYYREKGYDFARCTLPFQKIKGGVVKMHIIEGVIGAVRLVGDVAENDSLIRAYVEQISLGELLDESQLHRIEKMLNAIPGISVKTYTRTIPNSQKLELIFDVKQRKFDGEIYANNRGSRIIGPVQLGLSLTSYSLLGAHEFLRFHLLTTEETEALNFVEINSAWPVGKEGSQLIAESSYAKSKPGDILAPSDGDVDVSTAILGWAKPLLITTEDTLLLTGVIDYFRSDTSFSGIRTALDDLYTVRVSLDYITNKVRYYTKSNITLSLGVKGLNTTEISTGNSANTFISTGKEDFSSASFDYFYRITLSNNLFLSNQIQGQYAFRDLPISENIIFGGEVIGSAYDPAELFGDHGIGGKSRLIYQLENSWMSASYTQ